MIRSMLVAASFISAACALGQGSRADYERARALAGRVRGTVVRDEVRPHWMPGGSKFWYRNALGDGASEYIVVDAEVGTRAPLFAPGEVATAIGGALGRKVDAGRLPIERLDADGDHLWMLLGGDARVWVWKDGALSEDAEGTRFRLARIGARPTRRNGRDSAIILNNRTEGPASVFWINGEGQRTGYGTVEPGAVRRQHTFSGHVWVATDAAGNDIAAFEAGDEPGIAVIEAGGEDREGEGSGERAGRSGRGGRGGRGRGPGGEATSPDGKWVGFIRDRNVYVREAASGEEFALSDDGVEGDAYDGVMWWSPDSSKLVAMKRKAGGDRKVYYVESAPRDQVQPKLHSYDYLKPGDEIPTARPRLFRVGGGAAAWTPIAVSEALFGTPWSIDDVRWEADSSRFTFVYNERGHRVMRVVGVDAATGEANAIVNEECATFFDYAGKYFKHDAAATGEVIWMSERDGWNHLYLYDAKTGAVKNQITRGEWVVRGVDRVDDEKRQIWFRAGGIRPGQDPYYIHYARVNFDGTGLTILTEGDGTHEVDYSPDGRYFVDRYSRVDMPPVSELRRAADGSLVCELERGDWSSLLSTGWQPPERFIANGRDGATDIYGVIFRPTNFDPSKKYPVVEQIYAGPQDSFVPKAFREHFGHQEIAELGFIVVQVDGMGTSNRSKAFHDVCWKNLADAGFPDRIAWMKAAAAVHPEMDLSRVGIYGGSAGGQNALGALLTHGEFYKVTVADCGCHDNRMDKVWWNELWMGWPVGDHYAAQSNVTLAPNLTGKLLLVVGEMDENVDPASTMQVVDALIRADKDFELLVIPGAGHGAAETPYGRRRRQDFFVRHLLGVEPRWVESGA